MVPVSVTIRMQCPVMLQPVSIFCVQAIGHNVLDIIGNQLSAIVENRYRKAQNQLHISDVAVMCNLEIKCTVSVMLCFYSKQNK